MALLVPRHLAAADGRTDELQPFGGLGLGTSEQGERMGEATRRARRARRGRKAPIRFTVYV